MAYQFYSSGKIQIGGFYLLPPFFPQRTEQGRETVIKVHIDTQGVALCREEDGEPWHKPPGTTDSGCTAVSALPPDCSQ